MIFFSFSGCKGTNIFLILMIIFVFFFILLIANVLLLAFLLFPDKYSAEKRERTPFFGVLSFSLLCND